MSGHTGRVTDPRSLPDGELPFLQKPFDRAELARKVRRVLDA